MKPKPRVVKNCRRRKGQNQASNLRDEDRRIKDDSQKVLVEKIAEISESQKVLVGKIDFIYDHLVKCNSKEGHAKRIANQLIQSDAWKRKAQATTLTSPPD